MISIRNIVKQYDGYRALDNVSVEVHKGEIFGLLGPNGAGKTSLIRIINQITAPDSGEIYLDGIKLNRAHIEKIGYLPEERGLYKKMEIGEQILYLAQLKGMSKDDAKKKAKYWFEKFGIQDWWHKKIEELSKGMQQKAQFVATILHEPELLILDEPFTGFDPINADIIKNEILELNKKGTTIIFSTHRMESVEELCDSIALLHLSHKILDGKVKAIKESFRSNTYLMEYEGDLPATLMLHNMPFSVISESKTTGVNQMTLKINDGFKTNDMLGCLIPHVNICKLEEIIPTMNEIFIRTVSKNKIL